MKTAAELDAALAAAFPAMAIDKATLDEPTALWGVYDEQSELQALDGKTWSDVPTETLFGHPSLLVYAGDTLFRAMLPAYLRYLLHERARFNSLPFQVAGVLTRGDDPHRAAKFDRRVGPLTPQQRAAVRDVLTLLARVSPMELPMATALETWSHL